MSDIDTAAADSLKVLDPERPAAADSLKVLDPERPIREADMTGLAAGTRPSISAARQHAAMLKALSDSIIPA